MGLKKKNWLGQIWAQAAKRGPVGRVWAPKKNSINNWVGSGSRVLARKSGPGMQKPGPNPARCHSYSALLFTIIS